MPGPILRASMQLAHSSLSRCFQLSTNLDKDFFRYLWYCGKKQKKKQIECRLAWNWWNSTDLGLIDMFFTNQNAELLLVCYYYYHYSENRATSRIWKVLQIWFSPWGKNGGVLKMRMQVILDSLFRPRGFKPYKMGRKEKRVQGLD